jgi:hypothetical protein
MLARALLAACCCTCAGARYYPHYPPLSARARLASTLDESAVPSRSAAVPGTAEQPPEVEVLPPDVETKPVAVAPEAVNMICHHLIAHHRDAIVRWVNSMWCSSYTVDAINGATGESLVVTGLEFNVTGPLQPEVFFRCSEFKLSRARRRGAELLHADVAVEYRNGLSLALDVQRAGSPAYRMISPLANPVQVVVWGHTEGAAKVRLTLQADDAYVLRPAHVAIIDASAFRLRLEDYAVVSGFGFAGALRLLAGQLPMRRLESVANDAIQSAFAQYADGWDVCGGVLQTGPRSRRVRRALAR